LAQKGVERRNGICQPWSNMSDAALERQIQDAEFAESLFTDRARQAVADAIAAKVEQSGKSALVLVFADKTVAVGQSEQELWSLLAPHLQPLPCCRSDLNTKGCSTLSEIFGMAPPADDDGAIDGARDLGSINVAGARKCRVFIAADADALGRRRRIMLNDARCRALAQPASETVLIHRPKHGSLVVRVLIPQALESVKGSLCVKGVDSSTRTVVELTRKDFRYLFRDCESRPFRVAA